MNLEVKQNLQRKTKRLESCSDNYNLEIKTKTNCHVGTIKLSSSL